MQILVITGLPADIYQPCGVRLATFEDGDSEQSIIEQTMIGMDITDDPQNETIGGDHCPENTCEALQDYLRADRHPDCHVYIEEVNIR